MLEIDYNNKSSYIEAKEEEFRSVLKSKSFDSFKTQAQKIAILEGKKGLIWSNDLEPKVTKTFQAVAENFASEDILTRYDDSLSSSFIAKNWTEVLINKIEEEKIPLRFEEIVLFEKVLNVFKILISLHLKYYNSIYLHTINMNCIAYKNYEVAVHNLRNLCIIQRTKYSRQSVVKLQDMLRASFDESPRDGDVQSAREKFLEERYGDQKSKR